MSNYKDQFLFARNARFFLLFLAMVIGFGYLKYKGVDKKNKIAGESKIKARVEKTCKPSAQFCATVFITENTSKKVYVRLPKQVKVYKNNTYTLVKREWINGDIDYLFDDTDY